MRILIVKLSSLGDLFHALPAVHGLKTGLNAGIDWVTQDEYAGLVRCFVDVDSVISLPRRRLPARITGKDGLASGLRQLRACEYDMIVDLQGLLKSAIVGRLARGRRRIGPSFRREGSGLFYSEVACGRDRSRHAVDRNMDVLRHLELGQIEPCFPVRFPDRTLDIDRPRVAILPSSRWATKNWPVSRFAEVAGRLVDEEGAGLFLLGARADAAACAEIAEAVDGHAVNLAGKASLVETGGYLQQMDLLIANDSGPVHMAAAVGTPTLVMFGPTDPGRTGPYGAGHRVVTTPVPCRPCLSRTCARKDLACMTGILPEQVVRIAREMLAAQEPA
jgi:lipopolysaccharide heptosyltransferase I